MKLNTKPHSHFPQFRKRRHRKERESENG